MNKDDFKKEIKAEFEKEYMGQNQHALLITIAWDLMDSRIKELEKPDYKPACDALRLVEEGLRRQIGELTVENRRLLDENDKLRRELEKNRSFAV